MALDHSSITSIPVRNRRAAKASSSEVLGLRLPSEAPAGCDGTRAVFTGVESALFLGVPHFLTANRIHFAEKCSRVRLGRPEGQAGTALVTWFKAMPVGSRGLALETTDVAAAREAMADHGNVTSGIETAPWADYLTMADPDGHEWAVQQRRAAAR